MHVGILAIGRMKKGAENELVERYCQRFARGAASLGLTFSGIHEIMESRASSAVSRMAEEGEKIASLLDANAFLMVLDERGKSISSKEFAALIARQRDSGTRRFIVAIGGPEGHSEALRQRANKLVSFGAMTWPHQIIRVLAAEQLYRVTTILAGHPYHRA